MKAETQLGLVAEYNEVFKTILHYTVRCNHISI